MQLHLHERTLKDTQAELTQAFLDEDYPQAAKLFAFYVYKYRLFEAHISPIVLLFESAGSSKSIEAIEARLKRLETLCDHIKDHKNLMLVLEAYACLFNVYPFAQVICRPVLEMQKSIEKSID